MWMFGEINRAVGERIDGVLLVTHNRTLGKAPLPIEHRWMLVEEMFQHYPQLEKLFHLVIDRFLYDPEYNIFPFLKENKDKLKRVARLFGSAEMSEIIPPIPSLVIPNKKERISSTRIRNALSRKESEVPGLPENILQIIKDNGWYQ